MPVTGLSKSSEGRPTGKKGCISLRFADDAQLRGKRPYHPEGLISKVCWLGAHRLLYSRSGEVRSLSYLTRHVSSFASPTVSKRLESVWKHGP
jgi:hypothetical protein